MSGVNSGVCCHRQEELTTDTNFNENDSNSSNTSLFLEYIPPLSPSLSKKKGKQQGNRPTIARL